MSVSKVHHCIDQIKIAEGRMEPPAGKCRCRKYVALNEATRMVRNGEASWTVIGRKVEAVDIDCPLCHGDEEIYNCANCHGVGRVRGTRPVEDYGDDIVLVSRLPATVSITGVPIADKEENKRSSTLAQKTPRVATVEAAHIRKAYSDGLTVGYPRQWTKKNIARERIEEYGRLNREALLSLVSGDEPMGGWVRGSVGLEYERNPEWGRSVFSNVPPRPGIVSVGSGSIGSRISSGFRKIHMDGNKYGD